MAEHGKEIEEHRDVEGWIDGESRDEELMRENDPRMGEPAQRATCAEAIMTNVNGSADVRCVK